MARVEDKSHDAWGLVQRVDEMAVRIEGIYTLLRHLEIKMNRNRDSLMNAFVHGRDGLPDSYQICESCGREFPVWHDCG